MATFFLCYALVRENLPQSVTRDWPWKLKLLDLQGAVTAVIATGGAYLARAQYARTIRPALGYFGRVMAGIAPDDRLAWVCHLFNGGQDVAVTAHVSYRVTYTAAARARGATDSPNWVTQQEAVASLAGCGLLDRSDFALDLIGPGRPIPGQQLMFLGWFTAEAMRQAEDVFCRIHVVDRVGDTHERVISLLKGANRTPLQPDPPPF
ncbi:hypothetical protein ACWEFL_05550 [Streptomyces sp. NPDC004838]